MRIKHWQGYGSIKANKIGDRPIPGTRERLLIVKLQGNHECGLVRDNIYDVHRWLLNDGKRFVSPKGAMPSYRNIKGLEIEELYDAEENEDVAMYRISYEPSAVK